MSNTAGTSQAVFTDEYVLVNGKKILYSQINDKHGIVKDKFSFRLGIMVASEIACRNHALITHKAT